MYLPSGKDLSTRALVPAGTWPAPGADSDALKETWFVEDPLGFEEARTVGLCGASGAGKTQFLRSVTRMLLGGGDVGDGSRHRVTVSYVPQSLAFFPERSLRSNARALTFGRSSIEEVLRTAPASVRMALESRVTWSPRTLSGGEARLLSLSCAIDSWPDLLFLDETLASLDPVRLDEALTLIQHAVAEASVTGVLVVSHDPRVLQQCDAVYVMTIESDGRWIRRDRTRKGAPVAEVEIEGQLQTVAGATQPFARSADKAPLQFARYGMTRVILAAVVTVAATFAMMTVPQLLAGSTTHQGLPSPSSLVRAAAAYGPSILREGLWTLWVATRALVLAVALGLLFASSTVVWPRARKYLATQWVGLQAVPVIVLAPFLALFLNMRGLALELAVAVFISVFPLGLMTASSLTGVPEDVFLAHRSLAGISKLRAALLHRWGAVVRAAVVSSPLPAVGAIVGEYLAGDRGVGNLLIRILPETDLSVPCVVAAGGVIVALVLLLASTVLGGLLLPRDIQLD